MPVLSRLVTGAAIEAGVGCAVAIHAGAHGHLVFLPKAGPLSHRAVAGFAFRAGLQVLAVVEANVGWNLVHADPVDISIQLGESCELALRGRGGL